MNDFILGIVAGVLCTLLIEVGLIFIICNYS